MENSISAISNLSQKSIVFIDAQCVICSLAADIIMALDCYKEIKISALQGECAKSCLPESRLNDLNTVLYFREGVIYEKSDAALMILKDINPYWRPFANIFLMIPKKIRDSIYDIIAKNRFRLFGKKETCSLPNAETKKYFLP